MTVAHLVTVSLPVIARRVGNATLAVGELLECMHRPTAPVECILSLWNNVKGRPVMKGVDEATKPSFKISEQTQGDMNKSHRPD